MAPKNAEQKATTPAVDAATVDAVLSAVKARDRRELLEREGLVVSPRLLLSIGGSVRNAPNTRTKHSEGLEIPKASLVWPGETVHEESPGDRPVPLENFHNGTSTPWWRPLTEDEQACAVSNKQAVAFMAAESPFLGASTFKEKVDGASAEIRGEIAEMERKLAERKADLSRNEALAVSAEKSVASEKADFEAWVNASGKTLGGLRAAAELLLRKPDAVAPESSRAFVMGSAGPVALDARQGEAPGVSSETEVTSRGGVGVTLRVARA